LKLSGYVEENGPRGIVGQPAPLTILKAPLNTDRNLERPNLSVSKDATELLGSRLKHKNSLLSWTSLMWYRN
jgi:hypothetical protein